MSTRASRRIEPAELTAERLNRGFSIRSLAKHINVPEQSIRRAERGEGVSPGYAFRIASFFGHQVTDIWPVETTEEAPAA